MNKTEIVVADYSAEDPGSYLQRLEEISAMRQDGGLLHGGHIHFIQRKLSEEDGFPFLKAAIAGILELVPSVFPYDLPEQIEKDGFEITAEQTAAFRRLNEALLCPVEGYDIIRVILAAREYESDEQFTLVV